MPWIDDIAAEYVERAAALDPCYATYAGIAGHDRELADLGADGFAGRAGLDRSTLAALDAAEAADPREQVARDAMRERLALAGNLVRPGATVQEAVAILDEDPARRVEGRENFRAWMQELAERTMSELHGTHFDIPQPAYRIQAVIAPTNDGGMYYLRVGASFHG
jgi:hypothetical protein